MSDKGESLGDILARRTTEVKPPTSVPATPRGEDDFIVALAAAWGEDPVAVLDEFHANSPLARLARKLLGVNFRESLTSNERIYLLRERVKAERQLRGQTLDVAVADILNAERNAAGRSITNVSAESIRPMAGRGRRAFHARGLAGLFDLSGR